MDVQHYPRARDTIALMADPNDFDGYSCAALETKALEAMDNFRVIFSGEVDEKKALFDKYRLVETIDEYETGYLKRKEILVPYINQMEEVFGLAAVLPDSEVHYQQRYSPDISISERARILYKYKLPDSSKASLEKALRNAACNNKTQDLEIFFGHVDVNARDTGKEGRAALHWAVINGYEKCTAKLTEAKADINLKDNSGKTPLEYAATQSLAKNQQLSMALKK